MADPRMFQTSANTPRIRAGRAAHTCRMRIGTQGGGTRLCAVRPPEVERAIALARPCVDRHAMAKMVRVDRVFHGSRHAIDASDMRGCASDSTREEMRESSLRASQRTLDLRMDAVAKTPSRLSTTSRSVRVADAGGLRNPTSTPPEEAKPKIFFSGIHPPLGCSVTTVRGRISTSQRQAHPDFRCR